MKTIKITEIKPNPRNPRLIKDDKFLRLCKSLNDFPAMLEKRPVVVNEDGVILGGNMRYRAAKENGWKEIPVEVFTREDASKMMADRGKTYEEICDEFVIKDNSSFGEWDWEVLANEWSSDSLNEWGLDIPSASDYSDKNKEVDVDDFDDEMILKLKFKEDDFIFVKQKLNEIAETHEEAILKMLKNGDE